MERDGVTPTLESFKTWAYLLHQIFLLTLIMKTCGNQGAEDTAVLVRTFATLGKTGRAARQGVPSTPPQGTTALEQSQIWQCTREQKLLVERSAFLLPASTTQTPQCLCSGAYFPSRRPGGTSTQSVLPCGGEHGHSKTTAV